MRLALALLVGLAADPGTVPAKAAAEEPPAGGVEAAGVGTSPPGVSKDHARLAAGEIIVTTRKVPGSDVPEATVRAMIDARPEKVWAIVSDCSRYKQTMPNIADSQLLKMERGPGPGGHGDVTVCRVTADLPFPFQDLVSVTRAVHTVEPGRRWQRQWQLVEGDYERNLGMWRVEPFGADSARSLVTYVIDAKPKVLLPSALVTSISHGKLPEMMKNVRARVQER
jgi:ribosome-associated toxin RatA of RatAB toxin-antitoxin module